MVDIQDRALPQVGLMDMAAVALHRISHGSVVQLLKTDTRLADFGWSEFAKNGYSTSSLIAFVLFTVLTVGFFWVSVAIYAAARKNNGDAPIGALLSSFGDGVPSGCGQSKRAATESLSSTCDPIDSGAVAAKRSSHTSKGAHVSDAANDSAVGGKSTAAAAAKVLTAATNPTASAAAAQASVPTTNPPGTPPRFAPFTATANLGSSASANPPGAAAAAPSFSGGTGAITPPAPPSGLAAKFPQLPMAATLDFQKSEKEFLNRNGYVLVDCGDGKRSESCLFASILAQVDGGCMMASLDRCAKERAARLVFAFDYIQKCVNGISDDELPDFAKKAICALMKRLTMRDNSIVRDTQMLQLLSECIVAGDAFVADRDGKLTAAKADAENQIQRLRGENSGYLSVYLIGVDQPSESDPERFRKGYDAARKTCAEKGLKTEDDVSMLMAENASLEAKQQYIIDSKKKDVEWALGRLRALVSATGPSDGGNVKIPCLETLAAIFSLFAETFSTAGLNAFSKKHSTFDGSVNLLPKHFRFAGDENLGPIFYGIVYFLSVADKFSGACDMQDVAIEALRLNRDIVVYDEVHKTWIVFKWDGSDESYPPRNQLVKPIFLKHIRGHFQAYLPKGRAPK